MVPFLAKRRLGSGSQLRYTCLCNALFSDAEFHCADFYSTGFRPTGLGALIGAAHLSFYRTKLVAEQLLTPQIAANSRKVNWLVHGLNSILMIYSIPKAHFRRVGRSRVPMLLFVTTYGHSYTVRSLLERTFGAETPACQVTTYDGLFQASSTLQATHIFADIERLYDWELALAGELYHAIREAGLPCVNDPARVMIRYELLRNLHAAGINPFTAYRAEEHPRPNRFPVFVRYEKDHLRPVSDLLSDQAALDAELFALRERGTPLRGLIVIEFASEPIAPGVWRKFGTFRVGDAVLVDHAVAEDRWLVKDGKVGLATDAMFEEERAAVISNRFAEELRSAFKIAGIEWGRADHATFAGREIVYEVNTNPDIAPLTQQRSHIRDETLRFARERMAQQFWRMDFGNGALVPLPPSERLLKYRRCNSGLGLPSIRP